MRRIETPKVLQEGALRERLQIVLLFNRFSYFPSRSEYNFTCFRKLPPPSLPSLILLYIYFL